MLLANRGIVFWVHEIQLQTGNSISHSDKIIRSTFIFKWMNARTKEKSHDIIDSYAVLFFFIFQRLYLNRYGRGRIVVHNV